MRMAGSQKSRKSEISLDTGVDPESFCEYEVSLLIIDYYYCRLFVLQSML